MTRHTMNAMAIIAPVNGPLLLMNSANLSPSLGLLCPVNLVFLSD